MAIMFFYLCVEASVMGWIVTYYIDSGAAGDDSAQLLTSLLWITILIGRFTCSALSDRTAPPQIILQGTGWNRPHSLLGIKLPLNARRDSLLLQRTEQEQIQRNNVLLQLNEFFVKFIPSGKLLWYNGAIDKLEFGRYSF